MIFESNVNVTGPPAVRLRLEIGTPPPALPGSVGLTRIPQPPFGVIVA
jgi:hypothetical protein